MTETEWLEARHVQLMLQYLRGRVSERKLRLFACAWCRHACPHLAGPPRFERRGSPWYTAAADTEEACRKALDTAERFADGLATREECSAAHAEAEGWVNTWLSWDLALYYDAVLVAAATAPGGDEQFLVPGAPYLDNPIGWAAEAADRACQADLLREVAGNPFRTVAFDPAWRMANGGTVVKMARMIYDERRWEDLPFLADALEEAGCTIPELLAHLRRVPAHDVWWQEALREITAISNPAQRPVGHVRGCWALDLALGRE